MNPRIPRNPIPCQRGASSMFITVILVMVIMMLGVTAAVLSNTQFKLAGNLQFENMAFNLGEGAVATAESWLTTGTNAKNGGFTTYAPGAPNLYPVGYLTTNNIDPLTMSWSDSNSLAVGGNDNQRYLIEKYGADNQALGTGLDAGGRPLTGCQKVDVFRISARGTAVKGTTKLVQTVFSFPVAECIQMKREIAIKKGSQMKTLLSLTTSVLIACMLCPSAYGGGVNTTFVPNNQPTGWVGEVDVSNFDFSSGIETIFKGDYIKGDWSGNLYAFPVDADGNIDFAAERWSNGVADNVDGQDYSTGRLIVTMKADGTKIPFRWASLATTQQAPLGNSTNGPKVLNYIRGDRTNEVSNGGNYRTRTHVFGDVIHSRPIFVDDPSNPRVYVGSNDGMLHSFDADSGTEVFAYLPSFFISPVASTSFSNVTALTANPYVHNYFVDGSPNARTIGTGQTILVGGAGAGGKGLYALDISDPTASSETTAASKILWEITPTTVNNVASTAYADLGYTYGVPLIVKLSDGTWAALVGNGYNSTGGDQAILYVINILTGAKIAGIATSVTGTSDTNANGLSSPTAIDVDHDGKVDYVYAGDIFGNLWKFDIRTISAPVVTKLYTTSPAQAITGKPVVSLHPNGGYMVNFATGRMFTTADSTDASAYYAYGLWDNGTTIDPTKIVSQTLTAKTWSQGSFNYNVRVSSSNAVTYTGSSANQGWKLALAAGERVVGDGGLVTNSRYIFASTNPTITHAAVGGVSQAQGDNWLNEIDFTTGGGGSSPMFDLDANLQLDDADRVRDSGGTNAQTGPTGIPVSRYMNGGVISQPLVARLETLSQTYFNTNADLVVTPVSPTGDPGVSGGHFDFDIYYPTCTVGSSNYSCKQDTHVHQYDDKYNVTGVNMLAPSLAAFNVSNAITSTSTSFKILMANQKYSPAVNFLVGGASGVAVTAYETTSGLTMASLPTYTRSNISSLEFALPLNAFLSQDWSGTGDVRAGLVPTATGCVHADQGAGTSGTGPWMNGALTIQLVNSTTPDSAVELNYASDPKMGYRLKKDTTSQSYQLAQYTIFWHHPNGKCVGDAGWIPNPPQDTSGKPGAASAAAPGSSDPTAGAFGTVGTVSSGGGMGGSGSSGPSSTVTYTFADGSSVTQTTTKNADGSVTVTRVYSYGGTESFTIPPSSGGREADTRAKTGRVSWREMVRP